MRELEVGTSKISLALYSDVTNSNHLVWRIESTREISRRAIKHIAELIVELLHAMQEGTLKPEVALLNASLIPDIFPVLAAAHKALLSKSRDSLATRTLHSEIVYNYSGSKHITESLKRCGILNDTTYILAACFHSSSDDVLTLEKHIKGKEIGLEELESRANLAQIQKHYKITAPELGISSLADAIVCRIASRDAL